MKKKSLLCRLLASCRGRRIAMLGEADDMDTDVGMQSISLPGTIGGFSPRRLEVGGGLLVSGEGNFDSPSRFTLPGEPAVDRIGDGFFRISAGEGREVHYSADGLATGDELCLTVSLGEDYQGTLLLDGCWGSRSEEVSGRAGECLTLSLRAESDPDGLIELSSTAHGILRLSLAEESEARGDRALTLLCHDGDGNLASYTRILLPAPLAFLPLGYCYASSLLLREGMLRARVLTGRIDETTPFTVKSGSERAENPVFCFRTLTGRGEPYLLTTHGEAARDDSAILSGGREGISLSSGDPELLSVAISRQRLARGVVGTYGVCLDDDIYPWYESPCYRSFFPYADTLYAVPRADGGLLGIELAEDLRAIGGFADSLLIDTVRSRGVRMTRIGQLVLTGEENFRYSRGDDNVTVWLPLRIGQYVAPNYDEVPQFFSHGESSRDSAVSAPETAWGIASYLDDDGLSLAIDVTRDFASSLDAFRAFVRAEYEAGTPLTVHYPLASPTVSEVELIPSLVLTEEEEEWVEYISDSALTLPREASVYSELMRLWLARSEGIGLVFARSAEDAPLLPVGVSGRLRMAEGESRISTVGEALPFALSLSAYLHTEDGEA